MENNNNDLFELMTKMYSQMQDIKTEQKKTTEKLGNLEAKLGSLESKVDNLESKVDNIDNKVDKLSIKVEQDIEPKIHALFDGYSTNTEQLSTIKGKILRHDEVIMRSIK